MIAAQRRACPRPPTRTRIGGRQAWVTPAPTDPLDYKGEWNNPVRTQESTVHPIHGTEIAYAGRHPPWGLSSARRHWVDAAERRPSVVRMLREKQLVGVRAVPALPRGILRGVAEMARSLGAV